jgi:hypothetical protein
MNPRVFFSLFLLFATFCGFPTAPAHASQRDALGSSTEIVVVTTSSWNAVEGTLQRFQRSRPGKKWVAVGTPFAVVVGKNGLGWGSGMVPTDGPGIRDAADPIKKEGDGKAPAGVFSLSGSFGYAAEAEPGSKMLYLPLTASVECVDDISSSFYNRLLDRRSVEPDWSSSEHMRRSDDLYRWGIVVDHNSNPPLAGVGSCIFMHIWRGAGQGTVGCTAMPSEQMESLLVWLDPARKPLLVQMPEAQYRRVRKKWGLPSLPTGVTKTQSGTEQRRPQSGRERRDRSRTESLIKDRAARARDHLVGQNLYIAIQLLAICSTPTMP